MSSYAFPRLADPAGGSVPAPPAGVIAVNDAAPAFTAIEGGENPGDFTLIVSGNLDGPTLTAVSYDTGEEDYLTIGPRQGSGPWTWAISCDITGLAAGASTFSFDVEDERDASPETVSGTLTIDPQVTQPVIEVSSTTPSTSVEEGELSVEFTITAVNALGGPLPSLSVTAPSQAWLSVEVDPDGQTIVMQVDATSLTEGAEQATFDVECPEATPPSVTITVTANVTTDPALQLLEPVSTYNFGSIPEGSTTVNHRFNTVINAGSGTIDPSAAISVGDDWLSAQLTEEIAGERYGLDIACDPAGQPDGPLAGTVTLSSTGSADRVINVVGTIIAVVPTLELSTQSPSWVVNEGQTPTPYVLTITANVVLAGPTVSVVDYGAGPSGWLNVSTPAETSPGSGIWTSTLSPSTGSFEAGSYPCSFTVSDANTDNDPLTVSPIVQINDVSADIIDVPRAMDGTPIDPPTWAPFSTTTGLATWSLTGGAFEEPRLPNAVDLGDWTGTPNIHEVTTFAAFIAAEVTSRSQDWPIIRFMNTTTQTTANSYSYGVRTGAGWLCVQTANYHLLPQAVGMNGQKGYGTRVDETIHFGASPIKWLKANVNGSSNRFARNAGRVVHQGIWVENAASSGGGANSFWLNFSSDTTSQADEPTDLVVAHCIVDGLSGTGLATMTSAFWQNGNRACIRDGIYRGFRASTGHEEKAYLCTWGTGNYLWFNNERESRSIGILLGGSQSGTVQRNADCLSSHEHAYRRPSWISSGDAALKNLGLEVKSGIRCWIQACELENGRPGDQYHEFVFGPKPSGDTDALTIKVKHCGAQFFRMWNCTGVVNYILTYSSIASVKRWASSADALQYCWVRQGLQATKYSPTTARKGPRFGVGTTSDGPATDPALTFELYALDLGMENVTYYGTSSSFEHGCQGPVNNPTQVIGVYPRLVFRNNIDLDQAASPTSGVCFFVSGNLPATGAKALWDTTCGVDNYIYDRNYTRHSSGANRQGSLNNYVNQGVTRQNFTYVNVSDWQFTNLAAGDATINNPALQGTGTDGKDAGPDMPRILAALAGSYGDGLTLGNPVRRFTPTG